MQADDREEIFRSAPIPKAMTAIVFPTIAGQITTMIYNLTDAFFVGQTGDYRQVAAVSLTFPLYHLINALANLYGVGGGSLISRRLGEGKRGAIRHISAFCFYASIVTVLLFSLLLEVFMSPLLQASGAGPDTYVFCVAYMRWVAVIGGVPTMLSLVLAHIIRSEGRGKQAGRGMILGGAANIILDPIFISVLDKGIEGAAIATLIANVLSVLYYAFVLYFARNDTWISLSVKDFRAGRDITEPLFKVGLPAAIYVVTSSVANIVYNKLLYGYGDVVLAAAGVVKKLDILPLNISMGLSQGMTPLIAYNYAAKAHERMTGIIRYAMKMGVGICLVCISCFWIFPEQLVRFFIDESETVAYGAVFLRISVIATPLMTVNILINSLFQAVGKSVPSVILSVCRQGLINIPLMVLMKRLLGLYGIISTQILADGLTLILSIFLYFAFRRDLRLENCKQANEADGERSQTNFRSC